MATLVNRCSNVLHLLASSMNCGRQFHSSPCLLELRKLTRVRCVDNSAIGKQAMAEGKPPKIIHIYNKTSVATIGEPLYNIILCAAGTVLVIFCLVLQVTRSCA